MQIRLMETKDLPAVEQLYADARAFMKRIGNGGHQVSRTRSATGHTDRRFTVGARHPLSDKSRALFMTGQNMADLRALA